MRKYALQRALGAGVGLSIGSIMILRHQPKVRMDSRAVPRPSVSAVTKQESLDPDLMKQLSGGSVAGFLSGLLIGVFSRTLVMLLGVAAVVVQLVSRYGINLIEQLRLKRRVGNSRVLAALQKDPVFKLSFGVFFAMSAFMRV